MSDLASSDSDLLPEGKCRPGLKPGQKHSGSFKRNDSRILKGGRNNPLYQMKQAACSDLVPKALEAYKAVLADPSHKDHAAVARDVLNRVYGSPATEVQKAAQEALQNTLDPKQLSEAELLRIAQGGETIEGDYTTASVEGEPEQPRGLQRGEQ